MIKEPTNKVFGYVRYINKNYGVPPDGVVQVLMVYPDSLKRDPIELTDIFPNLQNVVDNGDGTVSIVVQGQTMDVNM